MKVVFKKDYIMYFIMFAILMTIVFGMWLTVQIIKDVQFDINCTQHIKRAADANTIETAKEELSEAISYAEKNNLTEGTVSIFLNQPKNDIGYWYKNIAEAYTELKNLPENATPLEKTNVLMKLRETLIDEDSETSVTIPDGISIYPYNVSYFWWGLLSGVFCFGSWVIISITSLFGDYKDLDDYKKIHLLNLR